MKFPVFIILVLVLASVAVYAMPMPPRTEEPPPPPPLLTSASLQDIMATAASHRRTKGSNRYKEFAYTYGVFKLIQKCKAGDVNTSPIALPVLNPLKISSLTSIESDYSLYLNEITVDGLQNMRVKRLSANLSRYSMSMEFVVPRMTVNADHYRLETTQEIVFASFNVVFEGNSFTCYISNLNIQADVQFDRSGSNTVVSSLRMQYTGDVQAHFSGSPDFVNQRANARIHQKIVT